MAPALATLRSTAANMASVQPGICPGLFLQYPAIIQHYPYQPNQTS